MNYSELRDRAYDVLAERGVDPLNATTEEWGAAVETARGSELVYESWRS
jgi:hypothetical protein